MGSTARYHQFFKFVNITTGKTYLIDELAGSLSDAAQNIDELKEKLSKVTSAYVYHGSVANKDNLPTSAENGWVYNVESDGMNYAWNAEDNEWDALGPTIDLTPYATLENLSEHKSLSANTNTLGHVKLSYNSIIPNSSAPVGVISNGQLAVPSATKTTYGTVKISDTLSEVEDDIVPSMSQLNTLLSNKADNNRVFIETTSIEPNTSDNNANCYGYVGTLSDFGINNTGNISITQIKLVKQAGAAPSNTVWARIVHVGQDGNIEALFESSNSINWGSIAANNTAIYEMRHINARPYPSNTERIAIYFVSSTNDADNLANTNIGLRSESGKSGSLANPQSSRTSLPGGQSGYRPVIGFTYYSVNDSLEGSCLKTTHENVFATAYVPGHVKLGTNITIPTDDGNFGTVGRTSNEQLVFKLDPNPTSGSNLPVKSSGVYNALANYVPLSGGTMRGALTASKLSTQTSVIGPTGVAPLQSGSWSDAGGAWKFDLIKGEIAITNNGWDSDENAMPASKTFLKFTDIATTEKVNATAESLDKRITSLETYGVQFKEDKRLDTTGLTYPLVKQNKSPFLSVYGPNGVTCRYSCNCFRHVLNETWSNKAYLYSPTGVYQGMLTNTGINFNAAHGYINCFCLVSTTSDFHYTVFNGYAYNNNKMIISKFSKEDGCPLLRSRQYSKRGVEGSIWQSANAVGPVVWNVKTGHILVFGEYYTNVYNDSGTLVDKPIGYGYLTFDEDLNFVKWDTESDAFVSSETYDETFLTLLPNSPANAVTAYWIFDGSFMTTFPTVVATTQNDNTTNGLGYLGAHDEIIPMTLSAGPYYDAGLDFVPLGGSRLSIDSTGIINYYAPHLMMSSTNADSENSTARVIKLFNGSRFIYITFNTSENDDGFTYSYRNNDYIKSTEFAGVTLYSNTNFQFLHGKYVSTYGDVGMFLYYNGFIYDRSGKYTRCQTLSFPRNNRDCSPQRGMYARYWQTVLSPVGDYQSSTGGVRLDM